MIFTDGHKITASSEQELHDYAILIGMKKEWYLSELGYYTIAGRFQKFVLTMAFDKLTVHVKLISKREIGERSKKLSIDYLISKHKRLANVRRHSISSSI